MGAHDMIVFDSLSRSNIPHHEKSMIRQWADTMTGGAASRFMSRQERRYGVSSVETFISILRQSVEQPAMGAFLGVLAARKKIEHKGVPLDFASGALLTGFGMAAELTGRGYGRDLVNLGTAGFTTFAFRKSFSLFATSGASMAGEWDSDSDQSADTGQDPIVEAAKNL